MYRFTGFLVAVCLLAGTAHAAERTYYIAADEVEWDYAPANKNEIFGRAWSSIERNYVGMVTGPHTIGRIFRKAIYREYTDDSFSTLKARPAQWEHLGILGPLVRAQVGDTIKIVFRNNASFPASVHPHGVFYEKDSEGALYNDDTEAGNVVDDSVSKGGTHTYVWPVPERAGPGPNDPSSMLWMYHSHTDERADVNAGLMGPIIISAPGTTRGDGTPKEVDREFIVAFWGLNESLSPYLEHNAKTYPTKPDELEIVQDDFGDPLLMTKEGIKTTGSREKFSTTIRDTLNGYLYANLPMLTMKAGERVRWYLMSGTNFELHAPHWHGNTVTTNGMNTDVVSLITMGMLVADMVPDSVGTWLFHCHVGGHFEYGMAARYRVEPGPAGSATTGPR